jgi:hypothetical protein
MPAMAALRNHAFKGTSSLPSMIIPCPRCGGRLTASTVKPAFSAQAVGFEDIAHGCARCGTELVRTVIADQTG